jgi:phosphoribosyl 1,2-cyclic phosphodiesterase
MTGTRCRSKSGQLHYRRMSFAFCVLGSGSAGNCTVLALNGGASHCGGQFALIDAGLSPRATKLRLAALGIGLEQITDIIFTHLDRDHYRRTWMRPAESHGIRFHIHRGHRRRAEYEGIDPARVDVKWFDGEVRLGGEAAARIDSMPFDHDEAGTVGFVIEHAGLRLGFATDLGRVPPRLFKQFTDLHALAIESNYDRQMQLSSSRPAMLKRRIMGGRGHLSNEQALKAVQRIAEQSPLSHVALLHLSRQCNCPRLVTSIYAKHAPDVLNVLTVTNQFVPSPLLTIDKGNSLARDPSWLRQPCLPFPPNGI